ncbi:STAS domain-containing protein [Streptomyces sp. NPDC053253]|uniref:STAS domain-containing protein n=1 Tax=Streptomyces sp. NPDC053253 TaxID=3365699 RepID=UPI0037D8370E
MPDRFQPATAAEDTAATARPASVAVAVERGPQRVLAGVRGEIDLDCAGDLRRALLAALEVSRRGLDVDLSGVTFCDASGLGVLLDVNGKAAEAGKDLVLVAPSPRVTRLFELTDTRHVFTVRTRTNARTNSHGSHRHALTDLTRDD